MGYPPMASFLNQIQNTLHGMPAMNGMNPLNLPAIPGMRGRYASRRRLIAENVYDPEYGLMRASYSAISKCLGEDGIDGFMVCIEYDLENHMLSIETGFCVDCDAVEESINAHGEELQYFEVQRLHFENTQNRQCQAFDDGTRWVCIVVEGDGVFVQLLGMESDGQWVIEDSLRFEFDADVDRKCTDIAMLERSSMCLVQHERHRFSLEIKSMAQRPRSSTEGAS